jgi:hypothetical protein
MQLMSDFHQLRTLGEERLSTRCGEMGALPSWGMVTIFVRLLNEGAGEWRPVDATPVSLDSFRVEGEIPEGEDWEFAPGTVVRCERKSFGRGKVALRAIGMAD